MAHTKATCIQRCSEINYNFHQIKELVNDLLDKPEIDANLKTLPEQEYERFLEFVAFKLPSLIASLDETIDDDEKKAILHKIVIVWKKEGDKLNDIFYMLLNSKLNKKWNLKIFEAILSRKAETVNYLKDIFRALGGEVGKQEIRNIFDLFVSYSDEQLAYLIEYEEILGDTTCSLNALKKCTTELMSNMLEAYRTGRNDVVTRLIGLGADIDQDGFFFETVRNFAISRNPADGELPISLIKTKKSKEMGRALWPAISYKNLALLQCLCENGALAQRSADAEPPLLQALQDDALEVIPVLLSFGETFDEEYKGKKIWDYVRDYEIDKFNDYSRQHAADYQTELPLIRESLKEMLVSLVDKSANFTDIRAELRNRLAVKMNQQAIANNTSSCIYTYLTNYQKKKVWGNAPEPTSWDITSRNFGKRREVLEYLIGDIVKVVLPYEQKASTYELIGVLGWRDNDSSSSWVTIGDHCIEEGWIGSICLAENAMQSTVKPKFNNQ
ncbi:MAG: hypothetical protein ACHQAX_04310 [Gammaproteobacteria bacterium]